MQPGSISMPNPIPSVHPYLRVSITSFFFPLPRAVSDSCRWGDSAAMRSHVALSHRTNSTNEYRGTNLLVAPEQMLRLPCFCERSWLHGSQAARGWDEHATSAWLAS
jgi:hypothetical protein